MVLFCKSLFFFDFFGLRKIFFRCIRWGGVFRVRPALSKTTHVESESDALSRGGIRLAVESGGEAVHRIRGAFFGPGFPPPTPPIARPPYVSSD